MNKAEYERKVFSEFASAAGIDIEEDSIQSENPPYPDISCRVNGETWYFELTRVADQGLANEMGHVFSTARKTGISPVGKAVSYSDKEAVLEAVAKKARINHKVNGCRFDLLLYSDGLYHPCVEITFVRSDLLMLEDEFKGKWNSIWLYDKPESKVLWPENEGGGTT